VNITICRRDPAPLRRISTTGVHTFSLKIAALGMLLVWSAMTAVAATPPPARQRIVIVDVSVVDLAHDRTSLPRTVLIDDGRIAAIADPRTARIPADALRVDGKGQFLIPGLVDMHVHLFNGYSRRPPNEWTFPLFIANGVTAVREMNADAAALAQVRRWRHELDNGDRLAPRILAAGVAVRGTTPDDAALQVDAAADAGADFIKVFSEVPPAHWRAILTAAQRRSLPLAGHVPAQVALLTAASRGQASNEHLMQAAEACSSIEQRVIAERGAATGEPDPIQRDAEDARVLRAFDRRRCRRVAAALAATRQVQVPTLVLAYEESVRRSHREPDPRRRYLRVDERLRWERLLAGAEFADDAPAQQRWRTARRIVSTFHRAGVIVLAGTDAPMPGVYPGFSLHEELALLVEAGLSPRAALRSATLQPAQFLGLAATAGSVEVGKQADLVLLDADPTRDIRNTRRIRAVVLDGRFLAREAIDALLEDAARAPASATP
jgi:imidazolonepropionase-like amidohydrolase